MLGNVSIEKNNCMRQKVIKKRIALRGLVGFEQLLDTNFLSRSNARAYVLVYLKRKFGSRFHPSVLSNLLLCRPSRCLAYQLSPAAIPSPHDVSRRQRHLRLLCRGFRLPLPGPFHLGVKSRLASRRPSPAFTP